MRNRRLLYVALILVIIAVAVIGFNQTESELDWTIPQVSTALGTEEISDEIYPGYAGTAYVIVNDNIPYFTEQEMTTESFESYSELDALGRCGTAFACIGQDIMAIEARGDIREVRPSGWQKADYGELVEGDYLYNRCHLISHRLSGENANERNLITGTRYLNTEGMGFFETVVADYVEDTGYHVMYRVTPIYEGDCLIASGVLMEAKSVEDNGAAIEFNVFCYNVQPGVEINYADGSSCLDEKFDMTSLAEYFAVESPAFHTGIYAVNGKNGKIHIVGRCIATGTGSDAMSRPIYYDDYEAAEICSRKVNEALENRKCGMCW